MAHALSVTDGTTTVSLTSTNFMLSNYLPGTPNSTGANVLEPLTEAIECVAYGTTTALARAAINGLERLLVAAERRAQTGTGARVYLQFTPDGDATAYRSELIAGAVQLAPGALRVFGQAQLSVRIIVTRVPYWEGARTQIPLTNPNGTNNTSGLSINNGAVNYVGISSANVTGVLPAPLELHMVNNTGGAQDYLNFYASVNNFDTSLPHHIEGETGTDTAGTDTASAECSGGFYDLFTVIAGGTVYSTLALSSTLLRAAEGRYHRAMVRLQTYTASETVYCTPSIWDFYNVVPLWVGNEVALQNDNYLLDLGVLPLPPGGYVSTYGDLKMRLTFRNPGAGAATIGFDFLQLLPSDPLCFRRLIQRSTNVGSNGYVVDDGIEGVAYLYESSAANPIYAPVGLPAHVWPSVDQRIYILHDGLGLDATWTLAVRAYYRPRRVTI